MEPLRKRPAASTARVANRNGDLARIHIAKKALNQTEDEYRDLLQALTGKRSAGELSFEERSRVAAHLDKLVRATKPGTVKRSPKEKKVLALWGALQGVGAVEKRGLTALGNWLKGQSLPQNTAWMNDEQLDRAIAQLKMWCARVGALKPTQ